MLIYCITNTVNGKKYVGKWHKTLHLLKYRHKHSSKKLGQLIYRAIRKYGWDSFQWDVLYEGDVSASELCELEMEFISKLDTKSPNGYNMTPGGEGGSLTASEEKRRKCGDVFRGRHHTEESKSLIRKARALQVITQDAKDKIGASSRGKSYEERYGAERAAELREARRQTALLVSPEERSRRAKLRAARYKRGPRGPYRKKNR